MLRFAYGASAVTAQAWGQESSRTALLYLGAWPVEPSALAACYSAKRCSLVYTTVHNHMNSSDRWCCSASVSGQPTQTAGRPRAFVSNHASAWPLVSSTVLKSSSFTEVLR